VYTERRSQECSGCEETKSTTINAANQQPENQSLEMKKESFGFRVFEVLRFGQESPTSPLEGRRNERGFLSSKTAKTWLLEDSFLQV